MARPIEHPIILGARYGHLTVLRPFDCKKRRSFLCRCDCGIELPKRADRLYNGNKHCSPACGLLRKKRVGDLTGKRYGRWTVIKFVGVKSKKSYWLCRCDCGAEKELWAGILNIGHTQSCGCLAIDVHKKYWTPEERLAAKRANARRCNRKNPARIKANKIKYEKKRDNATPPWITQEHWDEMNAFYMEARVKTKVTGVRHEVDHIYPIQGDLVSGLHVPWNLQVLTQAENVSKSNRYAELHGDMEKRGIKSPRDNSLD